MINNQVFFEEPNFPVLEFWYFTNSWREKECELFEHNSMETEDNPLISLLQHDCGWTIHSPWQQFECEVQFAKEELLRALDILQNEVICN